MATACGRPDIIPEHAPDLEQLADRGKPLYDLQKNVVIVCAEGIVDKQGRELGAEIKPNDPAGNLVLSGAANVVRDKLIEMIGEQDMEHTRQALFAAGNHSQPYHLINADVQKRIRYLHPEIS